MYSVLITLLKAKRGFSEIFGCSNMIGGFKEVCKNCLVIKQVFRFCDVTNVFAFRTKLEGRKKCLQHLNLKYTENVSPE